MHPLQKAVAVVWGLLGSVVLGFSAKDAIRAGSDELLRSASLQGAMLVALAIAVTFLYLSVALWYSRPSARPVGATVSILVGVVFFLYLAANLFFAIKLQMPASIVAVAVGALGIGFCTLSFRVSRGVIGQALERKSAAK